MIKINLLSDSHGQAPSKSVSADEPAESYSEEKPMGKSNPTGNPSSSMSVGSILAFLIFASLGGLYYYWINGNIATEEELNQSLNDEKVQLEPYLNLEKQFREQKESLKKKEDVLAKLKKQQQTPVYFLMELANSIPDNIWLMSLTSKGKDIEIKGESRTEDAIFQFRDNLATRTQWFDKVNYLGANRRDKRLEFTITFELTNQ